MTLIIIRIILTLYLLNQLFCGTYIIYCNEASQSYQLLKIFIISSAAISQGQFICNHLQDLCSFTSNLTSVYAFGEYLFLQGPIFTILVSISSMRASHNFLPQSHSITTPTSINSLSEITSALPPPHLLLDIFLTCILIEGPLQNHINSLFFTSPVTSINVLPKLLPLIMQ